MLAFDYTRRKGKTKVSYWEPVLAILKIWNPDWDVQKGYTYSTENQSSILRGRSLKLIKYGGDYCIMIDTIGSVIQAFPSRLQAIANPAYGLDQARTGRIFFDFFAQPADVDINRTRVAYEVIAPDPI